MRPNVGQNRARFFIFQRSWEMLNVMNLSSVGQTGTDAIPGN